MKTSKMWIAALALCLSPWSEASTVTDTAAQQSIVILGASYAKGWGTPALPGFGRVINAGVGGEETGDMLARMQPDVIARKPQVVLIWGHVNNITRSAPDKRDAAKRAAREHYLQMLQQARAAGIEVMFATEIPWTEPPGLMNSVRALVGWLRGRTSYAVQVSNEVRELNDFLRELAGREGLRLLDFERAFALEDGTRRPEYAAEDGSHISAAGYAALTRFAQSELPKARR